MWKVTPCLVGVVVGSTPPWLNSVVSVPYAAPALNELDNSSSHS